MQALRGTQDILPRDIWKWNYVEKKIRQWCRLYRFGEIRTPMFEATELFLRGIGDTTDVVTKEMYTFNDRGGRSITLRPENTAAVVRSFLEHKAYADDNVHKVFYIGSMFRYDRPQAGRFREFHQFGVETLGSYSPAADAECIALAVDFFHSLGLKDLKLLINSIGHVECRKAYRERLIKFLEPKKDQLCDDCKERLYKNPLRVLDCKEDGCKAASEGAPQITDYLCEDCHNKFEAVKKYLTALGIPYEIDSRLVRGLDYYTNTAFEIQYAPLGAQSTICGGGRYDGLVEEIGGPATPGIGFAIGLERLILALEKQNLLPAEPKDENVFVAVMGEDAMAEGLRIEDGLRRSGVPAEIDLQNRSLKGQLKQANKQGAAYAVIIGEQELKKKMGVVRDMNNNSQENVALDDIVEYLKKQMQR